MHSHNIINQYEYEYADTSNVCLALVWERDNHDAPTRANDDLRLMFVQHKSSRTKNVRLYGNLKSGSPSYSLAPLF